MASSGLAVPPAATLSTWVCLRIAWPLGAVLIEPGKARLTRYEKQFLEIAVDGPAIPRGCHELFGDHVHDPRAGFGMLGHHEPFTATGGYLRYTHVFKEQVCSESVGCGRGNEGLGAAKDAGDAVAQFFSELWDATANTYARVRERIRTTALGVASAAYQAAERSSRARGCSSPSRRRATALRATAQKTHADDALNHHVRTDLAFFQRLLVQERLSA